MKSQYSAFLSAFLALVLVAIVFPGLLRAQSLTTGDIAGTVEDPTGAAVPDAKVTAKNLNTGASETTTATATGAYRFSLLNPGSYSVTATSQGFHTNAQSVTVTVGQASTANIRLQIATASQVVEVSGAPPVIQTENANVSTNISPEIVANIPNPGNDLTYYIQTAPGATMNTQAGYGNSATYGISATSNLVTVDGMNENDPFFNTSNSGATNLLLGANDIQTATVVNNGYSGEYGSMAGANVNFVTKSGGNKFHGNAEYFWNGRVLNANDWFNNNAGVPRAFDNANQWAVSVGGPIVKNKTFFFVDNEGLRLLIPTAQPVNIPSPQFQAATLAAIPSSETPFYNQIFGIYNNAPGAKTAANNLPGGGCDGSVTLAGGAPCALEFQSNINNLTTEWLLTTRIDQNIGTRDRAFVHFRTDHGLQASITDPLSSVLNAQSVQPQYEGQIQENHQVGSNAVNQFIVAGSWYSAVFQPPSLSNALALMPYELNFSGGQFATPGSSFYTTWPQGRNVTQYQVSDDYAWQKGNHDLKFGASFRRNDITDYTPGGFNASIPEATFNTEASFLNGTADTFEQAFASRPTQPLALYSLGLYAQDEWAVRSNLKVTLSLRAEHNSDPICVTNCFARLSDSFLNISHDPSQPYNQAIVTGLHQALPNYQSISWEPRIGFAWQPFGRTGTVIRGGGGIFADIFPGLIATSFDTNSPLKNTFVVPGGAGAVPFVPIAPGVAGNAQSIATASNTAFVNGFNGGLNLAQIEATLPPTVAFTPPLITSSAHSIHYPIYDEWNLEIEQAIGSKMSVSLNYVGNHGSYLAAENAGLNAFCDAGCLSTLSSVNGLATPITSFAGLPTAAPDPRFTTVTEVGNPGVSNYNGLTASVTRSMTSDFQVQASFTWSHALDDISNGGFLPFNFDTNTSILSPQDPYNLKAYNYGNADYDERKQFNLSYVYNTPKFHGVWDALFNWTVAGTLFAHSGLPLTVIDGASSGALGAYNYGPLTGLDLFADALVGPLTCGSSAAYSITGTSTPCLNASQFTSAVGPGGVGSFGMERRNQVYGPGYFDTDLTLMKNFRVPHWESAELQVGAQAFNILNHPNFDQPIGDISNSQFGSIVRTVSTPTSIFGSFLGADASPRALQIRAQLTF
ncbi:MAG TPA: carboxypeptidase regulatory-like domain-containing protein [Verrucomicrobiae bacterium]|nr:carboxypeptidase regulatory-like domain-containing protein [Verrucomicrobiae bacterium]